MRAEMTKMADWIHTIGVEVTAIRHQLAGVVTIQNHDHEDIGHIKVRLDRIEKRLDLVD